MEHLALELQEREQKLTEKLDEAERRVEEAERLGEADAARLAEEVDQLTTTSRSQLASWKVSLLSPPCGYPRRFSNPLNSWAVLLLPRDEIRLVGCDFLPTKASRLVRRCLLSAFFCPSFVPPPFFLVWVWVMGAIRGKGFVKVGQGGEVERDGEGEEGWARHAGEVRGFAAGAGGGEAASC